MTEVCHSTPSKKKNRTIRKKAPVNQWKDPWEAIPNVKNGIEASSELDYDNLIQEVNLNSESPHVALERFSQRENKEEGVVDFVLRVYGDLIEKGLNLEKIRTVDLECYQELSSFYLENGSLGALDAAGLLTAFQQARQAQEGTFSKRIQDFRAANNATLVQVGAEKPNTAPELYIDREHKQENAPEFIQRVYGKWLTGRFTRADLRNLDKSCGNALRDFEFKYGGRIPRSILNLPTLKEYNDELLSTDPSDLTPEDRRKVQILRAGRKYRKRKRELAK